MVTDLGCRVDTTTIWEEHGFVQRVQRPCEALNLRASSDECTKGTVVKKLDLPEQEDDGDMNSGTCG